MAPKVLVVKAFRLLLSLHSFMLCYFWTRWPVKSLSKVTPLELLFVRQSHLLSVIFLSRYLNQNGETLYDTSLHPRQSTTENTFFIN